MKKIYYWANDEEENSGEGILARNFLMLLKKKFKNYRFSNLNKFKKKSSMFYNYFTPLYGVYKIWQYHSRGYKICYINYLPIWNIFIYLFLPKKTIFGPITGTNTKKNIIYNFLKFIGILILKNKKQVLFSHNQFKKYFLKSNINFFNFIFYGFKINFKPKKKKFDLVFYLKKNSNKGNNFLINLINNISEKFKIAIIGDKLNLKNKKKNITNFGYLSRKEAIKIIRLSKYALGSKENHFSFFILDSLSNGLSVFYNKDLKLYNDVKTNMFLPINFNDLDNSTKTVNKELVKIKNKKKFFKIRLKKFDDYLINL